MIEVKTGHPRVLTHAGICCIKFIELMRSGNRDAPLLLGSSTWKLQSPTINKDSANRIIDSRNVENSLMKVAVATGWVSEYGGGGGGAIYGNQSYNKLSILNNVESTS